MFGTKMFGTTMFGSLGSLGHRLSLLQLVVLLVYHWKIVLPILVQIQGCPLWMRKSEFHHQLVRYKDAYLYKRS